MKLRIQAQYSLAMAALILAVSAVVALTLYYEFRRISLEIKAAGTATLHDALISELVRDGIEQVSSLSANAAGPLVSGDGPALRRLVETGLQGPHVLYAVVVDRHGRPYAAGAGAEAPSQSIGAAEIKRQGDTLIITVPVEHGGVRVGTLRTGFSIDSLKPREAALGATLDAVLASGERMQQVALVTVTLVLLLAGLLLGGITARRLSGPVRALAQMVRHVDDGDPSAPWSAKCDDEIAELAAAFGRLRESLGKTTVSRDFLYRIIDNLNEGLLVTGTDGEIHLANRAISHMFGYRPEELAGKPFSTLVAQPEKFYAIGSKERIAEWWFLHKNGSMSPVAVSRAMVSSGDRLEQVYVISDIAERKRLEDELWIYRSRLEKLVVERTKELTAAIHELESFSYSVSHDLHAPLRAINGFGAALCEDYYHQIDPVGRGYLDRMRSATVRMGQLIDGLLVLSRVARSELRKDTIDLSSIASDVAGEIAANEPRRQATFRIAPEVTARGDASYMRLLLQNLFANAWKFTMKRGIALIEFGQIELHGERTFFVRDNGEGFDPVCASGLFRPFHRLHSSDFPGNGIGLATVQRIVHRHGGRVWAEAEAGEGAVFYFTLPDPPVPAQVEESRVSSRMPLSNSISSQRPSATA